MRTTGTRRKKAEVQARDELGRKQCGWCLDWLPVIEFRANNRPRKSSDGLDLYCKECVRLSRHNLTRADAAEILAKQDHRCAICQKTLFGREWDIDHDHSCCPKSTESCGECMRGILCRYCNRTVVGVIENESLVRSTLEYLGKA